MEAAEDRREEIGLAALASRWMPGLFPDQGG